MDEVAFSSEILHPCKPCVREESPTNAHSPVLGTWRLQSFEVRTSGEDVSYPYGEDAKGYLIYTQDGYMAVAVMKASRANFDSADMLSASLDEKHVAFDTLPPIAARTRSAKTKLFTMFRQVCFQLGAEVTKNAFQIFCGPARV
jgi:hypothetical protein